MCLSLSPNLKLSLSLSLSSECFSMYAFFDAFYALCTLTHIIYIHICIYISLCKLTIQHAWHTRSEHIHMFYFMRFMRGGLFSESP